MIGHAQAPDGHELPWWYRCHPHIDGLPEPLVQHQSRTFVARDDDGRIIGLALVSRLAYGVRSYGVIHELEVRGISVGKIRRALFDACRGWLEDHGTTVLYATPAVNLPGCRPLQHAGERGWVLDPDTGQIKPEGDGWGPHPPAPVQAAYYTQA
jgi:hypothetical protein